MITTTTIKTIIVVSFIVIVLFLAVYSGTKENYEWNHYSWNNSQQKPFAGIDLHELIWNYTPDGNTFVKQEDLDVWDRAVRQNYKQYQTVPALGT